MASERGGGKGWDMQLKELRNWGYLLGTITSVPVSEFIVRRFESYKVVKSHCKHMKLSSGQALLLFVNSMKDREVKSLLSSNSNSVVANY